MPDRTCADCGARFTQKTGRPAKRCADCRKEWARQRASTWYAANSERVSEREALKKDQRTQYRNSRPPCVVGECGKPRMSAAGHCSMHAARLRRTGDVGPAKTVRQKRNGLRPDGYKASQKKGATQRLEHRQVMEQALGRPLELFENVHHRNGIRHDNALSNLEVWVTPQPKGQRPEDLAEWVVEHYPELVRAALRGEPLALF